ncbi:hypothetical protein HK102_006027 [Quaeritorhiza haematococci]|nr:hypothetical protein HK102_006027 [Quaeritorhiza haematococci]
MGRAHKTDDITNVTPSILSKISRRLHLQPSHPLGILKRFIESHFNKTYPASTFSVFDSLDPVVTVQQNFDELLFPPDHPGRALTDTYYVNRSSVLRTHTSAHQGEVLRTKASKGYLLTADVYRRDEINCSHYPIFHQMEGILTFDRAKIAEEVAALAPLSLKGKDLSVSSFHASEGSGVTDVAPFSDSNPKQVTHTAQEAELVGAHLRRSLEGLVLELFGGEPLEIRWIDAYFPFTSPSWEMEVKYQGEWLELCGCGVIQQKILDDTGNADRVGWAFGLGLERIAMYLYKIPDIRLFWSTDPRFHSQFSAEAGLTTRFQPFSKYPACYKDVSFWLPPGGFHENEFCDIVREVAGDLAEDVKLIDEFVHPKTKRVSRCYRINYRSMERTCLNEEIDEIQAQVCKATVDKFGVEIR